MSRPKVVVFDLGKVLVDFDYGIVARNLAARGRLPAREVARLMDYAPLLVRFETGLLTTAEFCREACSAIGFEGTHAEFATCFAEIFTEIEPMVRMQARLRGAGVPTFIFSNTNELAVNYIRRALPFFGGFTGYILSYEHGCMKPDPRLYAVVERACGFHGEEILYLDDRAENIATGASLGWQTILHRFPEETLGRMRELGFAEASL